MLVFFATHEPSSALLSMTPESLVATILELGLLSQRELEPVIERMRVTSRELQTEPLLRALVDESLLTRFQARQIWNGKAQALVLGNYLIIDRIGKGGMGTVYKARHRWMQRVVAIKVIDAPEVNASDDLMRRFQREVRAAAKLSHPNIVTAFDADRAAGSFYLVMEFVQGHDLGSEVTEHGSMSVPKAVACVLQAARGLAHAHSQGIIHRDIKPRNLLLADSGIVKVLDLGLARVSDSQRRADESLSMDGSQSVGLLGTIDFMSPEQAEDARKADVPSDIYSLGCTLFYLLSGHSPYERENWFDTLVAHQSEPVPSLNQYRSDVPVGLQQIIERMLAKVPGDRFASMNEVIQALTPFDDDSDFQVRDDVLDESEAASGSETRIFDSASFAIHQPAIDSTSDTKAPKRAMGAVLGIDIGADSLRMATLDQDLRPTSVPNFEGSLATPAALFVTPKKAILTGTEAASCLETDARHGWERIPSFLGEARMVRAIYGQKVPPEIALGLLLDRVCQDARARIGKAQNTFLTVPHVYDDSQRVAVLDAARLAGLEQVQLIDELEAAALAYLQLAPGFGDPNPAENSCWMLVQLGACNASVGIFQQVKRHAVMLGSHGDPGLGGHLWDQALIDYSADAYQKRYGHDPRKNQQTLLQLARRCEAAKRALSREQEVQIEVQGDDGAARIQMTRSRFQRHTAPLIDRLIELCRNALRSAGKEWNELDRVVLSGGSTRMPAVRRTLAQLFGKEPKAIPFPDESLAMGAAISALTSPHADTGIVGWKVDPICHWNLGIVLPAGPDKQVFSSVFASGTKLPATVHRTFRVRKPGTQVLSLAIAQVAPHPSQEKRAIGKLIIKISDPKTEVGAPLEMQFHLLSDGRLAVEGKLLGVPCSIEMERSGNLRGSELSAWLDRIKRGSVFESDEIGLADD